MNRILRTQVFADWFASIRDAKAKARITGYRVYFTRTGKVVYILLCGGDKSTQAKDIRRAKLLAKEL